MRLKLPFGSERSAMKTLTICLCLALSGCSSSNLGKSLNVAVVGSGVADLVTTEQAIDRGGREWNRLMGDSSLQRVAVKFAGIGGVIALAGLVEVKGHPIYAHLVRGIVISLWSAAAIHNGRLR